MAEPGGAERASRGSVEFVESSILDTIVPFASDLNIEEALSGSVERLDEGSDSPLATIPKRHSLFFDETIDVYIILQTPYFNENALRSYLGRLVVKLEAQVFNGHTDSHEGPPGHETIYTGSVQDGEDPLIVVQGPDEAVGDNGEGHIMVVWKLSAFLIRPRLRLQNPSIVFSATASLKPSSEQVNPESLQQEYLPSQVPSGINLLESFGDDPGIGGVKPRLSALRVSRVLPMTQVAMDLMRPLKNISRTSIKCYPAINARVRYTRPHNSPNNPAIIVSLDVDVTPFANCEIELREVQLSIKGGSLEDMNDSSEMALPITCLPLDDITFLYRVQPDDLDVTTKSLFRALEISIQATIKLSEDCQPKVSMRWTTSIDFTPALNPSHGHATAQNQRPQRQAQASLGDPAFETLPTVSSLAITRPDALPTVDITTRQVRNSQVPDFGVTVTFTGPSASTPIHPGVPFVWSVFIVNRSDRPRKLALNVIPKRRRTEARMTRPPSTGYGGPQKDHRIADAVVDENIVYAMQRNSTVEPAEVICLTSDTRIGPLAPSACYEVELRFMAMKAGSLSVEAVRVVDLGTQEHVDVVDLPSILVSPVED